jgi:hypothetical protein
MLLRSIVTRRSVCLRQLGRGRRARQVGFGRFLANRKVTIDRLIEGWSDRTAAAVKGRHVLAIQDTSEINFCTTPKRRCGLGEIGKGNGRGLLVHMLALDAKTAACLGPVGERIWTRRGRIKITHQKRRTENKESHRWIATAEQGKAVLAAAAQVTVIADQESDIFVQWATVPEADFHLITRSMHDRRLAHRRGPLRWSRALCLHRETARRAAGSASRNARRDRHG